MCEVKKYKPKPIVKEACHFIGTKESVQFIIEWLKDAFLSVEIEKGKFYIHIKKKLFEKDYKTWRCCPGDFVVKGVEGEFYVVTESVFNKTYEEI